MAHRRTGSKKFANSGHISQTCKRHHYPRRSREGRLGHEVGDKEHEHGFEHGDLTGDNPNPLGHDHPEGKGRGYNNTLTLGDKGDEVRS